jgi:hypothetical protein
MQVTIDAKELIRETVAEVLRQQEQARTTLGPDRLAYSEAEAARLLGLNKWQLAGERRLGRITASKGVGGRVMYRREDLERYLNERRISDRQ